jgi:hypothetical protein
MSEYSFHISTVDTYVALECEADRAEREGIHGVAKRQRATALHLRNAEEQMRKLCPEGHIVEAQIVLRHVVDVNAVARRT